MRSLGSWPFGPQITPHASQVFVFLSVSRFVLGAGVGGLEPRGQKPNNLGETGGPRNYHLAGTDDPDSCKIDIVAGFAFGCF